MSKIIREYNRLPKQARAQLDELNNLDGKEWARLSRSINVYKGPITDKRRLHGAAFPPALAEHFIRIFTNKKDWVLDPFMGVGTTGDAAQINGRNFIGIELSKKFFTLAKQGVDEVDANYFEHVPAGKNDCERKMFNASCLDLERYVAPESIALTLTSPPYANLLNKIARSFAGANYSKSIYKGKGRTLPKAYSTGNTADFGNLSLEEYGQAIDKLMAKLLTATKPGGYTVWVVRDYREMTSHLPYVNLHGRIIDCAARQGWVLSDIVVWDQTDQRHLVKLGGKLCRRFYFNIGHSFILCFRKNINGEKFYNAY